MHRAGWRAASGSMCVNGHLPWACNATAGGPPQARLVDDDVADIDVAARELLHQALRLVQGQELRDADAGERGQLRVAELRVHLLHHRLIRHPGKPIML